LIAVPFQIRHLPEHLPTVPGLYVSGFRNGNLNFLARVLPLRTNFKDRYALPFNTICQIYFVPDMYRRSALAHERLDLLLALLYLKFTYCHFFDVPGWST